MKPPVPLERDIQAAILDYLRLKGIYAWRNNTGFQVFAATDKHARRVIRTGVKGSSDILGIMNDGRFLAIECKRPGKKASPEQQEFLDTISNKGGVAFVATSVEEAISRLY